MAQQPTQDETGSRPPRARRVYSQLWLLLAAVIFVLLMLAAHWQYTPRIITDTEALANADVALCLERGDGFSSRVAVPLALSRVQRANPQPDLLRPPVYPVLLAALALPVSHGDGVLRAFSALWCLVLLVIVYLWSRHWFDERTALLTVLLLGLSTFLLREAVSARPTMLSVTLATLALMLCVQLSAVAQMSTKALGGRDAPGAPEQPLYGRRRALFRLSLLIGALTGLAVLCDYLLVILVPLAAVCVFSADRDTARKNLAAFGLVLLAILMPWMIRNFNLTGNPFFSLSWYRMAMYTDSYPAQTFLCEFPPPHESQWRLLLVRPAVLARKLLAGSGALLGAATGIFGIVLAGFALTKVAWGSPNYLEERLRRLLIATFAALFVMGVIFFPAPRVLLVCAPLGVLLAVRLLLALLDHLDSAEQRPRAVAFVGSAEGDLLTSRQLIVCAVLAVAAALPSIPALRDARPAPPLEKPFLSAIRQLPPDVVIATDAPWDVAWRAQRDTVLLPVNKPAFEKVNKIVRVDAVALSKALFRARRPDRLNEWRAMVAKRQGPEGFVVVAFSPQSAVFVRLEALPSAFRERARQLDERARPQPPTPEAPTRAP